MLGTMGSVERGKWEKSIKLGKLEKGRCETKEMGTKKGGIMENVGKWREENMGIEG